MKTRKYRSVVTDIYSLYPDNRWKRQFGPPVWNKITGQLKDIVLDNIEFNIIAIRADSRTSNSVKRQSKFKL